MFTDEIRGAGSLYLSKVIGGPVSENEARNVLARYGALEKVWFCSQTDKEMFRLPDGIWVMFAYFQDCRDAQTVSFPSNHFQTIFIKRGEFGLDRCTFHAPPIC